MFCLQDEHWRHLFPQLVLISILCTAFNTWYYQREFERYVFVFFPAFESHLLARCIHPPPSNCSFHTGRRSGCCAARRALVECYVRGLYGWRSRTLRSIIECSPAHTLQTQSSMHTAVGAWRGKFRSIFICSTQLNKTSITDVFYMLVVSWCR